MQTQLEIIILFQIISEGYKGSRLGVNQRIEIIAQKTKAGISLHYISVI